MARRVKRLGMRRCSGGEGNDVATQTKTPLRMLIRLAAVCCAVALPFPSAAAALQSSESSDRLAQHAARRRRTAFCAVAPIRAAPG
jgi:hypothetical protein